MHTWLHQEKRPHGEGVGPEMLSPGGLEPTPQQETFLSERRISEAIAEAAGGQILADPTHRAKPAETVGGGIYPVAAESRQYKEAPCPI